MDESGESKSNDKDAAPGWNNAASSSSASSSDSGEGDSGRGYIIGSTGKREWIPSKEYQLQPPVQPTQYQPRKDVKRESEYSSSSSSKSNDWFDDRSSYDAFGSDSSSSSDASRSRKSNMPMSPQGEADRLDSERILNELLMDLDTDVSRGSSADGEVDYFDFSMDSNDVRGGDKSSRSREQSSVSRSSSKEASAPSSVRVVAPKMEDFASFEQYLDALVSHERTTSMAAASEDGGKRRAWSKPGKNEVDALDDNLVAFLGGEGYSDIVGPRTSNPTDRFQQNSYSESRPARTQTPRAVDNNMYNSRSSDSDSRPARVWTPKTPAADDNVRNTRSDSESRPVRVWTPKAPVEETQEYSVQQDEGLNAFLDSLEETNVIPRQTDRIVAVAIEEKLVPAVAGKKAAPVVAAVTEPSAVVKGKGKAVVKSEAVVQAVSPESSNGNSETLSKMSVKDLKEKLREKGLPVSGNKAELVQRLSV